MPEVSAAPFISREDLGDYLGQDFSTSDKALIAVDAACDTVRALAEQTFNQTTDDEIVLDGTGTDALLLPERPVTDVSEITVGTDDPLVVDDDYKLNDNGVLLRLPAFAVWTAGRQNIAVTYTHGYTDDTFPRDLRLVALDIAARMFQQAGSGSVVSETLGSYSVRYADPTSSGAGVITANHDRVIAKYRQPK